MAYSELNPLAGPNAYTQDLDVEVLTGDAREWAFREWLIQCWLADNDPPQHLDSLVRFDLERLRRAFPIAYRAGDWRRMRAHAPAGLVRATLMQSLLDREPCGAITNRVKPIDEIGRLQHVWHAPSHHLVMAIGALLGAMGDEAGEGGRVYRGVWLHDGRTGHVVVLRRVDTGLNWFGYDETTWPSGKSMLSEGENVAGVAATRVSWPDAGEYIVSRSDLERVIAGLTGPLPVLDLYRDAMAQVQQLQQKQWAFGDLPEGWGDIEIAPHIWKRHLSTLLDAALGPLDEPDHEAGHE